MRLLARIFIIALAGVSLLIITISKIDNNKLLADKHIVIPKGYSIKQITKLLAKNDIINYPFFLEASIRFKELRSKKRIHIKAGEYYVNQSMTIADLLKDLIEGKQFVRRVTFAEGLMTSQIIEILNNAHGLEGEIIGGVAEGSLMPDTYNYHYGNNKNEIIFRMQKSMADFLDQAWNNRDEDLPFKNKNEALILASIVEKETGLDGERGLVASVFINRLNKRMKLQSDPTTIYAITKGDYVLDRELSKKDLSSESTYNTYHIYGLPSTPIANPGRESILAVLNPEKSDYLYFVANGNGGHNFAKNLEDHNKNVRIWRSLND